MKMKAISLSTIPWLWVAVGAVVVSSAAAVTTLVRALKVEEASVAATETIVMPHTTLSRRDNDGPNSRPNDDPFFPGRTPPATRYQLINAGPDGTNDSGPTGASVPAVHGTVIVPNGASFAVISIDNGPRKNVYVGGTAGAYTVETIEQGSVVFLSSSGQRITVRRLTQ